MKRNTFSVQRFSSLLAMDNPEEPSSILMRETQVSHVKAEKQAITTQVALQLKASDTRLHELGLEEVVQ